MKPLNLSLLTESAYGNEIPLDIVVGNPLGRSNQSNRPRPTPRPAYDGRAFLNQFLTETGGLRERLAQERERIARERAATGKPGLGDKGIKKAKFNEALKFVEKWYTDTVAPMLDNEAATADDVYESVTGMFTAAIKQYDLDQDRLSKLTSWMNEVRADWAATPEASAMMNRKTKEIMSNEDFRDMIKYDIEGRDETSLANKQAAERNKWETVWFHRLGALGFRSEKEQLAAIPAYWITKSEIGGSELPDMQRRLMQFGGISFQNSPDTGATAKGQDWERNKEAHDAAVAKNKAELPHLVGNMTAGRGHVHTDKTGKEVPLVNPNHGSVGPGKLTGGQIGGPPPAAGPGGKVVLKKRNKPAEESVISRLAASLNEDINETWRKDSRVLSEDWRNELVARDRQERDAADNNPEEFVPSQLADMPDFYASIVQEGESTSIYVARDRQTLQEHPEAMAGDIVQADEVPNIVNDDDFILNGGIIEQLDETMQYTGGIINDDSNFDYAVGEVKRKIGMAEKGVELINNLRGSPKAESEMTRLSKFWVENFETMLHSLNNAKIRGSEGLTSATRNLLTTLGSSGHLGVETMIRQTVNNLSNIANYGKNFVETARNPDMAENWVRLGTFMTEEGEAIPGAGTPPAGAAPAAGAPPAAPPATPAAKPAAKPDPNIAKAKQEGGKALDLLMVQLKTLQAAPDWDKIKNDLVTKLKPYLG